jgi:hypothetical protein
MTDGQQRSFEFNNKKIATSRFHEHIDANNINEIDFHDDGFDIWFLDQKAFGEMTIMSAGGIGHDVRIELTAEKPFSRIHENDVANIDRIKGKLYQLGARLVAINDDVNMEFWQYENRMFILQRNDRTFQLFCSMEFASLDSAIRQIENVCRIETFMA